MRCCGLKTGLTNPVALNSVAADLLISAVSAEDWLAAMSYDPEVCLKNYMAYSRSLSLRGRSHQPLRRLQGDPIPDGRIDSSRESANRKAIAHRPWLTRDCQSSAPRCRDGSASLEREWRAS